MKAETSCRSAVRRRPRSYRARRVSVLLVAASLVCGCDLNGRAVSDPPSTQTTSGTAHAPTESLSCPRPSQTEPPSWAAAANPPRGIPSALTDDGSAIAYFFGDPLVSPPRAEGAANKILWISRFPRNEHSLKVVATRVDGAKTPEITVTQPADSSPGEIYPTIIDVPTPGCWLLSLSWGRHRDTLSVSYALPG